MNKVFIYYKGYKIKLANQTGGKAGKGCNKTTTLQVFNDQGFLVKQARVVVGNDESFAKAKVSVREWIDRMVIP